MHNDDALREADDLVIWIHKRTDGLVFNEDDRNNIGERCFHLALEHHVAITVLVRARLYGSAWALARLLLEAYVRGTWLIHHASPLEIKEYMSGNCPRFPKLVAAIGTSLETGGAWLTETTKKSQWSILNEYTHGGASQVSRRHAEGAIESSYNEKDLTDLLSLANEVAIQVTAKLFALANQESLLEQLSEKAAQIRKSENTF